MSVTPGLPAKDGKFATQPSPSKLQLEWDGDPNQIPTKDKRFIWVDSYARWRITDQFRKREPGNAKQPRRADGE